MANITDLTMTIQHNKMSDFAKLLVELAHDDPKYEPEAFVIISAGGTKESLIDYTSTKTDDQEALVTLLGRLEFAKAQVLDRLFVLIEGEL